MNKKGFTLIELLVVVAVIGLLATVVLASLGRARDRAKDAKIKMLLTQMRTQAEIFNTTHGSYNGTVTAGVWDDSILECNLSKFNTTVFAAGTTDSVHSIMSEIIKLTEPLTNRLRCSVGSSSYDSWAFVAPLYKPESGTTSWCVDSSGNSKATNISMTNGGLDLGNPATAVVKCP